MNKYLITLCAGLLLSSTVVAGSFTDSQLKKRDILIRETSDEDKARYAAGLTEVLRATEDEREQRRAERDAQTQNGDRQRPEREMGQRPERSEREGQRPERSGPVGERPGDMSATDRREKMQEMQEQRTSQREAWLESLSPEEREKFDKATMQEKREMWREAMSTHR